MPLLTALTNDAHQAVFTDYRDRIMLSLSKLDADVDFRQLLFWGMKYLATTKKLPKTLAAILQWFEATPTLCGTSGSRDHSRGMIVSDLEMWATPEFEQYKACPDPEVMISVLLEAGRQKYHEILHKVAANMASGAMPADLHSPDLDIAVLSALSLPDQARLYVAKKCADDPFISNLSRGLEGDMKDNLVAISAGLDERLREKEGQRLLTGIKVLDDAFAIGPEHLRWIGLLGYTSGGKSTFLKSVILEFAKQGARILFVPREEDTQTAADILIWGNAHDRKIPNLPSYLNWRNTPEQMGVEQELAKDQAIAAWNELPGSVEIIGKETLAEILEHYESNKLRKRYTCLVIDYVGKLEAQRRDSKDSEQDPHKRDFVTLQALSLRDKIVVFTPLQANREGFKDATDGEKGDVGAYVSCNAVEWYSVASQGMDVVIGTYYHGDLMKNNLTRLSCVKPPRNGQHFAPVDVYVDPVTRRCRPVTAAEMAATVERETAAMLAKQTAREKRGYSKDNRRSN